MPNGDGAPRNWVRLVATLEFFHGKHGSWPTRIRLRPDMLSKWLRPYFRPETWERIEGKLEFVEDPDSVFVAENDAGQRFDYRAENLHAVLSKDGPDPREWLGVFYPDRLPDRGP